VARPRITIITPVLNRADMIAEALGSVARQGYPDVEHIVVDGGSTDGTVDILRRTPDIEWLSEPDRGLYDAINKGIHRATGEIIGHVNSDDILLPGALAAVADGFAAHRTAVSVCGGAQVVRLQADGSTQCLRTWRSERIKRLDWHSVTLGVPITNARFFRRSWYRHAGLYDLRYRLAADRDFLIRALILGMQTVPLERTLYQYRLHGGSLTLNADVGQNHRLHDEYLALAQSCMSRADSPEPLRRMARRWFSVEITRRLAQSARRKDWPSFHEAAAKARRVLPGWPIWLAREALYRISGGMW
jgi:glycosyltransferase involved in cell wall biosynthesis